MAKDQPVSVKDVVYEMQLFLLDGIRNEEQLFAAGSVMSCSDYQDVVTERTIANICGYPLCQNPLPSDRPRKGRYRISLKEHKVYDLEETYMYCSSTCVVNSKAFAGSLQDERCSDISPAKLVKILSLFENLNVNLEQGLGKKDDLGLSSLTIHEKNDIRVGEVSLGLSNAIEGYVPQDRNIKGLPSESHSEGSKSNDNKLIGKEDFPTKSPHAKKSDKKAFSFTEMDFMSTIITSDEYSISKASSDFTETAFHMKSKETKGILSDKELQYEPAIMQMQPASMKKGFEGKLRESKGEKGEVVLKGDLGKPSAPALEDCALKSRVSGGKKTEIIAKGKSSNGVVLSSANNCQNTCPVVAREAEEECYDAKAVNSSKTILKPSLKSSGAKKLGRSVTWADEKADSVSGKLCEVREMEDGKEGASAVEVDDDNMLRYASAEACAIALNEAAEAVVSEKTDPTDAVYEAGIIILPPQQDGNERESLLNEGDYTEEVDRMDSEPFPSKWPNKPGTAHSDLLDSEDSWFDEPPEGFSLTLSPFATMWMALFGWITSSSLACIYGRDENSHEEFLSVNGRSYPTKTVLGDGRSSQIKQTLAGCISRALPGLVSDLRLPIPVTSLEQGLAYLLDTMSFMDALPAFRIKQWQVIVLLFIDALSICRIPALTPYMTNRRALCHKVLDGAQISAEEYDVMTDFIIPLGRAPHFSARSGG